MLPRLLQGALEPPSPSCLAWLPAAPLVVSVCLKLSYVKVYWFPLIPWASHWPFVSQSATQEDRQSCGAWTSAERAWDRQRDGLTQKWERGGYSPEKERGGERKDVESTTFCW